MKLVSYKKDGKASYGIVKDGSVIDVGARLGAKYADLGAVIAGRALGEVQQRDAEKPDVKLADIEYLPTIPHPGKIVCIGYNYRAHVAETGAKLPEYPSVFLKMMSAVVGHEQPIVAPKISGDFDYEGELAVVIGGGGRHIPEADAMRYVVGYTIMDDGSVRDWQRQNLIAGKNFPNSGSMGPWMTTADEIPDHRQLVLTTRVNGEERQRSGVDKLIFDIPKLIAYVSSFTRLEPGDVISTGTPEGVAWSRKPPLWLKPGDVLEIEVSKIGTLRNRVISEAEAGL
jgi:2-keto-4-pentenoate hydratase/2-oxohepta-3-ene-1,7-dioic acid hydratase in catechol pathway